MTLTPRLATELVERASNGYERWLELVAQARYCIKPIRLIGRVEQVDSDSGEIRTSYDTEREPDKVLLVGCGDRRQTH